MQLRIVAALCLATSTAVPVAAAAGATAAAAPIPAVYRRQAYGSDDGNAYGGSIQVYSPTSALATCTSTSFQWQWTGETNNIAQPVSIYIQSVNSAGSRRDLSDKEDDASEAQQRRQASLVGRMNKVRRSSSSTSHHALHARAGTRLLATGVNLLSEEWDWSSIDVNPGLYRLFVVLSGSGVFGASTVFPVLAGADTSCLGGAAAALSSTSSSVVWGVAPQPSSSSTSVPASLPAVTTPALTSTAQPLTSANPVSTAVLSASTATASNNSTGAATAAQSEANSSTAGGVHGGVIAAIVILPLAALLAIGMGVLHVIKKRKEEQPGSFIRTVPSSDALGGAGGGTTAASGWANRLLARTPSRGDTFADLNDTYAEKAGDNRASVFSDIYGGMDETANKDDMAGVGATLHRKTASGESIVGRPSMAEVSLADAPYMHCQSITTMQTQVGSGRPSMTSLRSLPLSTPLPLIVEDRPTGRSYDLPRATYAAQTVTSPTESEQAFTAGGWTRYADVGAADVEGARALTPAEVDTFASSSAAVAAARGQGGIPPRPLAVPHRLSTIPGSQGGESMQSGDDTGRLSPEQEMPYPDTPRPYSVKNMQSGSGTEASHCRPSIANSITGVQVQHQRQGSAGGAAAFPPRSASSMSGKYFGEGASGYATLQRSASNGSMFAVRRKPVPTALPSPTAVGNGSGPFSDENAASQPGTPASTAASFSAPSRNPQTPRQNEFPETPDLTEELAPESVTSTPAGSFAAEATGSLQADAAPVMDKQQYKLSVDLNVEPLRFSKF